MHPLHIALHDGFQGQHIRIAIDGQTVFDRAHVITDLRISRADAVDVDAPTPRVSVSVSIEPGGIAGSQEVDVTATPYVSIDLAPDGSLHWKCSAEPFRYM
jgi:hypothetical protein